MNRTLQPFDHSPKSVQCIRPGLAFPGLALLFILSMLAASSRSLAQTTLVRGDLVITGFSAVTTDSFQFVVWKPMTNNTQIRFTDCGFNGTGSAHASGNIRAQEQVITWTNTTGSTIPAGTRIRITPSGAGGISTSLGSVTAFDNAGLVSTMNLTNSPSDQIFAYQSTNATVAADFSPVNSATSTFSSNCYILYGFTWRGAATAAGWSPSPPLAASTSYLPSELNNSNYNFVAGTSFLFAQSGTYTGTTAGESAFANYTPMVTNLANWTISASTSSPITFTTTNFTISVSNTTPAFTLTSPQSLVVCQNAPATDIKSLFNVNDADAGQTLTWTQQSAPSHGSLSISGATAVSGSTSITPGGTITYTPAAGYTGADAFTVRVSDGTATADMVINATVTSLPSGSTVVSNVSCFGGTNGTINLTPSGGTAPYGFNWGGGVTTEDRTGLTAGSYSVTITDNNGCSGTVNATVTQPLTAVSGSTVISNVSCFGGSNGAINLTPTGGTSPYTYNWGGGLTTEDRTGLTAGSYSVTITDNNGCTGTVNATVTQPLTAVSGSTVISNVSCFGGSNGTINLTPTGGTSPYTYNWGGGVTTEDRTGLVAGSYSVVVTDNNGCTGTVNATVTQPVAAVSGSTVISNVSCFGGSNGAINLTPTGGTSPYTYNWGGGVTTEDRTGLVAGSYSVVVTDNNGCTGTVNATVTQPVAAVSGSTVITNISCFGGSNGAINLTAAGGTSPYTYNWGGGITTEDRTGLIAGSYSVIVTDNNGCTGTVNATITQPVAAVSGSTVVTNVSCFGGSNGTINLTPTGGTSPYTYNWGSGVTTEDRTGLTAGSYAVTITDNNGCTGTVNVSVTQPLTAVSGSTVISDVSCFGGSNGAINLTPTGGTSPYTYNWGGGVTTEDRTGLTAGSYAVTVTDNNGCTGTVNATVTQPLTAVSGSTVVTNISCFGGSNGAINLTPTGGTSPYTYNWGGGVTTEDRTGLTAGSYSVTITDNNGCTGTVNATVTQPVAAVSGSTVISNVSCFGGSNGAINLTPTGGTSPYTYNWGGGVTSEDRTGLTAGSYAVTVTDN
ncbi:MAG: hypothetical protein EOP49_12075, partial [Sphingobacteriales bacterium]